MVSTGRRPMVMVSGAGGLQEKGGRSPPPKRGRLGGGRCICDTLLSPSACSTEGFFRRKNAFRIQRSRATERGLSRGNLSPLTLFWFLLQGQKKRHGGEPCWLGFAEGLPRRRRVETMMKPASRGMGRGTAICRGSSPPKGTPLGNTSPLLRIDRSTHFYYYGVGKYPRKEHLI